VDFVRALFRADEPAQDSADTPSVAWVRRALLALAAVGIALSVWALYGSPKLNYDTAYALVWGDQLVRGQVPDYEGLGAPTPHPLQIGAAALAALLDGDDTYRLVYVGAFLSFGLLLAAIFRLGHVLHSTAAGLIAVAIVGTSGIVVELSVTAAKEITFSLIIVVALLLELKVPRRGAPVLLLLAVAGLIRPEAWAIAGAYWLYLARGLGWRERAQTLALALLAPALWVLSDLLVSGDAMHSFNHTQQGTEDLGRPTGVKEVPNATIEGLRPFVGVPGLVGAVLSVPLLVARGAGRWLPLAGVTLLALVLFAVQGVAQLPLTGRLLMLAGVGLAVLCAVAVVELVTAGWRARGFWSIAAGTVLLVALVSMLPDRVDEVRERRQALTLQAEAFSDLRELARTGPAASTLRRCSPVSVYLLGAVGASQVPYLLHTLSRDPDALFLLGDDLPSAGAILLPRESSAAAQLAPAGGTPHEAAAVAAGFTRVGQNATWVVYRRGC
jgi:hypothetical protein